MTRDAIECAAYLCVIRLAGTEERLKRVVGRNQEAGGVDEKFAGNVEKDQEKVQGAEAEHDVDLWY